MKDLKDYRLDIDRIDHEIIRLLEERFDTARGIIRYKQRKGIPILDQAREQEKILELQELCDDDKRSYVTEILIRMMDESKRYQREHPLEYGLLGRTLGHSHSPAVHQLLGGYEYGLFEREPEQLDDFFREGAFRGINVTIPYKRDVMSYCQELSQRAIRCNSVNTIVKRENGYYGDNTDYDGFLAVVRSSGQTLAGKKALIFGSGGVSGTVYQVLTDLGCSPVVIISRTGQQNYENLSAHRDAQILVNTTPVGMFPSSGQAVVDVGDFPACEVVFDLIYNPLRTKLMLDAQALGIPAYGGLLMLVAQAASASELFTGASYDGQQVAETARILEQRLENIVLIGMPGAGKTTTGERVARMTGKEFLDLDEAICRATGKTSEEIIRTAGVDRFREIETEVTRQQLSGRTGLVVATGGGCVERQANRDLLRENSKVVYLMRDLADLPTSGRPVSQSDGLKAIFQRRQETYLAWSDLQVSCIGPQETAEDICRRLQYMK